MQKYVTKDLYIYDRKLYKIHDTTSSNIELETFPRCNTCLHVYVIEGSIHLMCGHDLYTVDTHEQKIYDVACPTIMVTALNGYSKFVIGTYFRPYSHTSIQYKINNHKISTAYYLMQSKYCKHNVRTYDLTVTNQDPFNSILKRMDIVEKTQQPNVLITLIHIYNKGVLDVVSYFNSAHIHMIVLTGSGELLKNSVSFCTMNEGQEYAVHLQDVTSLSICSEDVFAAVFIAN